MTESTSPSKEPRSRLAEVLEAGHMALTVEFSPPVGPNRGAVERQIELLRGYADAYNVTDNQSARVHTSSLAVSIMLKQAGLDPILQVTCRDRNRLGIQSDLLGASIFGVSNVLALGGDSPSSGDHPHTKGVFDIGSSDLIRILRGMRDDQLFENGEQIPKIAPDFFIGAASNPFGPLDKAVEQLAVKADAGAQFIQTQLIYNVPRFREFMERVIEAGLHERVSILAGIGPIRSLRGAEYMKNEVAGIDIPDEIIDRMSGLGREEAAAEGVNICIEIAEEVREIKGVQGLHIMAVSWASIIPELVTRLGLHPRP